MEKLNKLMSQDTDISAFIKLYERLGIKLSEENFLHYNNELHIILKAEDEGFDGYYFFFTRIIFDKNGKFISQGFWE